MSENKSFLRNIIGEYMSKLGKKNDKVVVVNADLSGTCRNKNFVEENPHRAFNTGIAEQNMMHWFGMRRIYSLCVLNGTILNYACM